MLYINGNRGSGKTAALIGAFKCDPAGVLLFPNRSVREYALLKWPELETLPTCIPFNVERVIVGRSTQARLYVDEIGMIDLSAYVRSCVVAATGP